MIARREVGSGAGMVPALSNGEQTGAKAELASGRVTFGSGGRW